MLVDLYDRFVPVMLCLYERERVTERVSDREWKIENEEECAFEVERGRDGERK